MASNFRLQYAFVLFFIFIRAKIDKRYNFLSLRVENFLNPAVKEISEKNDRFRTVHYFSVDFDLRNELHNADNTPVLRRITYNECFVD